jgi:hypothetical protein
MCRGRLASVHCCGDQLQPSPVRFDAAAALYEPRWAWD